VKHSKISMVASTTIARAMRDRTACVGGVGNHLKASGHAIVAAQSILGNMKNTSHGAPLVGGPWKEPTIHASAVDASKDTRSEQLATLSQNLILRSTTLSRSMEGIGTTMC